MSDLSQPGSPSPPTRVDRDALFERCYTELRAIADQRMSSLPPNVTLQPTALLHEAYLRVRGRDSLDRAAEAEFVLYTSRAMRDILVEKARSVSTLKRRGAKGGLSLEDLDQVDQAAQAEGASTIDLLDLEAALEELEVAAPLSAEVVQLRYFGGLSIAEAADVLQVSTKTIERRWELARAWLARNMGHDRSPLTKD